MNIGKLKRVAKKEFMRSPVKSGILLALLPLALYFCVPLLLGSSMKTPSSGTRVSSSADFVLPDPLKRTTTNSPVRHDWVEIASRLDNDLASVPAEISPTARNPFAAVRQSKTEDSLTLEDEESVERLRTEAEEDVVERTIEVQNPIRAFGLELNATIVGQRSRLATINGKTYQEGDAVPVDVGTGRVVDGNSAMHLTLTAVDRRFVVLEMEGHQHRLQLLNEVPKDAIVIKPLRE